jgi:hypothetical protein
MFGSVGISSNTTPPSATGVVGIAIFLSTVVSIRYVDKLGWKVALIAGALGMATCHIINSVIIATGGND